MNIKIHKKWIAIELIGIAIAFGYIQWCVDNYTYKQPTKPLIKYEFMWHNDTH